ncbi:MAG: nitrate reductase cytochrome c-type subunit, partial [Sulfurovaceae bacterium]|nr:nitrate reductase cytochrome c-type subunit [Sulfurovaceae bacterium]
MGVSKVVKDMSKEDIVKALQGYKAGTYGGAMKGIMAGQAKALSDADMASMADAIKGGGAKKADAKAETKADTPKKKDTLIDINKGVQNAPERISKENLGNKKVVTESTLGLRKDDLYKENNKELPAKTDYSRPAPGSSTKFERAYFNAPPMIPHSVDGLLPIKKDNNQCLGCHMPAVAKSMGATPLPVSHFTNYRPTTVYKDGELVKEGKIVGIAKGNMGNVGDIKIAKVKKSDKLYQGRFNCSQCHAPQSKTDTDVANTFTPDFRGQDKMKAHSTLADAMNEGVQ